MVKSKTTKNQNTITNTGLSAEHIDENSKLKDELGRRSFANTITKLITSHDQENCLVVGIEGSWGDGKSYTIEQIRREIEKYNQNLRNLGHPEILWVNFNPWHFTDTENLAHLFLRNLSLEVLPKKMNFFHKARILVSRVLNTFAWVVDLILILAALTLLILMCITPFGTDWLPKTATTFIIIAAAGYLMSFFSMDKTWTMLSGLSSLLRQYAKEISPNTPEEIQKSLEQLKKDISLKLKHAKFPFRRLIISIEDLDRLAPSEVRSMVQLIRMVADFTKVTYLIGYDREQVIRALGDMAGKYTPRRERREFGEGYLQKVVHAAFQLPKPPANGVANIVLNKFYELVKGIYGKEFTTDKHWQNVSSLYNTLFETVRDGERVLNRALLIVMMMGKKSNPADVLTHAYLLEYQNKLSSWIWKNRERILSGSKGLASAPSMNPIPGHTKPLEKPIDGYLEENIVGSSNVRDAVKELVESTFPSIAYESPGDVNQYRAERRIASRHFLENYFRYDISLTAEIEDFIPLLLKYSKKKRNETIHKIKSYGEEGLFTVIRALRDYAEKHNLNWQKEILPLLSELGGEVDNESASSDFGPTPGHRVFELAVEWLNQHSPSKSKQMFKELITNLIKEGAIYIPLLLVEKAGQEINKMADRGLYPEEPFKFKLEHEEYSILVGEMSKQIDSWIRDYWQKWITHPCLPSILSVWLQIEPTKARDEIDKWVASDWHIMELVQSIMTTQYRSSTRNRTTVIRKVLHPETVKSLLNKDVPYIIERVKNVASKNAHISEKYADVIDAVKRLDSATGEPDDED